MLDILYSMKAIGNKEWNHYNVTSSSVLVTVRNKRRLFHEG